MLDSEYVAFQGLMRGMSMLRGYSKLEPDAGGQYFRVLKAHEFGDVARAADSWAGREQFFPAPSQWLEAVARVPKGEPLLELSVEAAREYVDAQKRGYEAPPCTCSECVEAGVDERPMRFVPNEDRFGQFEQRTYRGLVVLVGHWSHGFELARWYRAKAECYEVMMRLKLGQRLTGAIGEDVALVAAGAKPMPKLFRKPQEMP